MLDDARGCRRRRRRCCRRRTAGRSGRGRPTSTTAGRARRRCDTALTTRPAVGRQRRPPGRQVEQRVAGRHPGQRLRGPVGVSRLGEARARSSWRSVARCTKRCHDRSSPRAGQPVRTEPVGGGRFEGDVQHEARRHRVPSCAPPGDRRRAGRPGSTRPGPRPGPRPRRGRRSRPGSGRSAPPGCPSSAGATPSGSLPSPGSRRSGRRTVSSCW